MKVSAADGRIHMTGTDAEIREAADAFENGGLVTRIAIVPAHPTHTGAMAPAQMYAEVTT